ncbi:MAG TPA: MarR family transcriptional regulator [Chitinophagales bacterium]|nr:MarR family transcriptional regulator [Chitinophagales bacterium]
MLDKKTQKKLEAHLAARRHNITRGLYIAHRYVNEWALKRWKEDGWGDIRPDHLRLISIISMEPLNINELSKRARVSKQAMSKMVGDLISKGFIAFETDPKDSRSKIISITKEGVDFLSYFVGCAQVVKADFESLIGAKKTEQLISILGDLSEGILEREKKGLEGK